MLKVKISATSSTNTYLREYYRQHPTDRDILVWTDHQYAGRGQQGAVWESEPYKNLTASVFKKVNGLKIDQQFYITMATSLAVRELLVELGVPDVMVKWPNDILSGNQKICGILIESVVRQQKLLAVIIGLGININQTVFARAPRATSVKLTTGKHTPLEPVVDRLINKFDTYVKLVTKGHFATLKKSYEDSLFRRGVVSVFENSQGVRFNAIIKEVTHNGALVAEVDEEGLRYFGHKEAILQY